MNKKASILMINLWILALLVIFTVGLGHRASINLKLLRYQRDALKASLFANAGINKAVMLLVSPDTQTKKYDTIDKCGVIIPDGKEAKDIFTQNFGKATEGFIIGYNNAAGDLTYGMTDEERKILIDPTQKEKIGALFQTLGILSAEDSNTLTDIIIQWISSEDESVKEPNLDKKVFKNQPLVVPEEMLLILECFYAPKTSSKEEAQKQAVETYSKIKDFITVYGEGKININTADEQVLKAIELAVQKQLGTDYFSVDVVDNILNVRESGYFEETGLNYLINKLQISESKQVAIIKKWVESDFLVVVSDNFRIQCQGYINKVIKNKTIVFNRKDSEGVILYCHQN